MVRLWHGVLLLPLIGHVDSERAEQMMQTVLTRVVEEQAKIVVIDVSGVPTLDTYVAHALLKTITAVRLLGAQIVVTGIAPRAAKTMVNLGVDLSQVSTENQLSSGLELALSILGMSIGEKRQ